MEAPRRARKGSTKNYVGIYADIDPDLHDAYVRAVADRGITKRKFIEAAIRRELTEPTVKREQEGLYDVA